MITYTLFTDGSDFKKTTRRLGVGGVLLDQTGGELGRFSEELDRNQVMQTYGTSDCSNPFAELMAVKIALQKFSPIFGDRMVEITVKADYQGVRDWMTGKWKATAPYIAKLKQEIQDIIDNSRWTVNFVWIRGHRSIVDEDTYWNNVVDKLAKGV